MGRRAGDATIDRLVAAKADVYEKLIGTRDLLYPGAADFVRRCAQRFPQGLATGTLRCEAELIRGRAGLRELFVDIVAAEDVERSKPESDAFVAALGRLGFILRQREAIQPSECLAIEDTPAGIEAARRAGMRVLAVAYTTTPDKLASADLVRDSLADTDLDDVLRRLS